MHLKRTIGLMALGTPDQCRERSLKYWLAHPLTAYDVRGLRAIYA